MHLMLDFYADIIACFCFIHDSVFNLHRFDSLRKIFAVPFYMDCISGFKRIGKPNNTHTDFAKIVDNPANLFFFGHGRSPPLFFKDMNQQPYRITKQTSIGWTGYAQFDSNPEDNTVSRKTIFVFFIQTAVFLRLFDFCPTIPQTNDTVKNRPAFFRIFPVHAEIS